MNTLLPQHIAIVMDGNGRWAQYHGMPRFEGHRAGVESVKAVIKCCLETDIPILSLFAFSSENWARPKNEVKFLMQLFVQALKREVAQLHDHEVCLRFCGDRSRLSSALKRQMQIAEQLTQANTRLIVNVVINYGGKWDIVQATKTIAQKVGRGQLSIEAIDETELARCLSTSDLPDPDLFIRTSGEQRISNFFLWQLAYTEMYFTEIYWPDFNAIEFHKALNSFKDRERRYGKILRQAMESNHV